ncbi:MAG: type I-U CRISPR-associated protein Cas7 [Acidimicrobiaceae bacterium]|nr:type I-U CRISPR-associated protein Cas7 [Acidimicrobiaceae bacterium]MYE98417.1 type I-U CRISPR-associated protein Cas7 [Acidimicrobiaceae bacterium]MYI53467.1 type I-U CRISPR-associated protein Cas7 [Acidimicrobiaceae bacterium]
MAELTIGHLTDAVEGGAVALRSIMSLQPADGPGGKVFPPTYAVAERAEHKYAVEERHVDGRVVTTVLLDSVASQANRAELALLEGWEAGELNFPVPYVDFTTAPDVEDLGRITVLEAPHRLADAIFRDSLLDGTLFRLSDVGRAITEARPGNATDLFRYAPTALLFGQWDSTGPKGGLGAKFQRAYVSEIVGLDAKIGRKVSSRIDPLQIERLAPDKVAYNHQDPAEVWTFDEGESETGKGGKPEPASRGSASGTAGQPSKINHGNIAPSIDSQAGGVTISEARQTAVLSLAALRRLRFAGKSREAEAAARTAVAALGVAAIAYGYEADHDLRSRCLLIPQHAPKLEIVGRDGGSPESVSIGRESAAQLLSEASARAERSGIAWEVEEVALTPAPKLVELLRRSREVSAQEPAGE